MRSKAAVRNLFIAGFIATALLAACQVSPSGRAQVAASSAKPVASTLPQSAVSTTPDPLSTATPQTPVFPTPTPAPTVRRLTEGGCCVQPFWNPAGDRVLFLDKPSPDVPAGIWGVSLKGGAPELFTDRLGIYSPAFDLVAYPQDGRTIVERMADRQTWEIPAGGRAISFSPDGAWVAWTTGDSGPPFDTARRQVWISRTDGSQARQIGALIGGGFNGWLSNGRLLISGSPETGVAEQAISVLNPADGSQSVIAEGERLRGLLPSPSGEWLAYAVTFSADPGKDGLWLAHLATGETRQLETFGAYRWRDGDRLLLAPLDTTSPSHRILEIDAATGKTRSLTDPGFTPFRIANGDWAVSPDGSRIVFVSAEDHSLWVIEGLP